MVSFIEIEFCALKTKTLCIGRKKNGIFPPLGRGGGGATRMSF
jgi:hypothetical protein